MTNLTHKDLLLAMKNSSKRQVLRDVVDYLNRMSPTEVYTTFTNNENCLVIEPMSRREYEEAA